MLPEPEEGRGGRLGSGDKGHPAESVIDGTNGVDEPLMEYMCVFMNWAAMEKDNFRMFNTV